jgi:hypothetical protein
VRSYSQQAVFTPREVQLFWEANRLVALFPEAREGEPAIRCHEVARAVGELLDLTVEDGHFGTVDHSWLWTEPVDQRRGRYPNILDVYAVGSLPMVQLVDMGHYLPHNLAYRPGDPERIVRKDIRRDVVDYLKAGSFDSTA